MKDILVVFTGGTIGSAVSKGIISQSGDSAYEIVRLYEEESGKAGRFECVQPFGFLSENITAKVWEDLAVFLSKIEVGRYKGIIITHGTDTLSYTASMLGTLFHGMLKVPVVMVSAGKVPSDPESNALDNFIAAVDLIDIFCRTIDYNDLYVTWKGRDFAAYRGVELTEADTSEDNFGVYGNEAFIEFYPNGIDLLSGGYEWRPVINDAHRDHCMPVSGPDERLKIIEGEVHLNADILAMHAFPGLDFENLDISGVDAILVYSYHSGTFCTEPVGEDRFSLEKLEERCRESGKTLYAASFKDKKDIYESECALKRYTMSKLYDMSFEAAYANCMILESLKKANRR